MGSRAHVLVLGHGADAMVDVARARLDELERRWSRFLPDSEISRVNAAAPAPVIVSPETCALIVVALRGWRLTDGLFDPTVLGDVIRAGYDRPFVMIPSGARAGSSERRSGCAGIVVDEHTRTARLPEHVGFDPGGIGKGLAADLVVDDLVRRGAEGACVNVGGDVRVAGRGPSDSWKVDVLDPLDEHPVDVLSVAQGAVATSSRATRQWTVDGRRAHHLIDPATGRPAATGLVAVTALAGTGARAEVLAKAAFVAGRERGAAWLEEHEVPALLVDDRGEWTTTSAWYRFRATRLEDVLR